MDESVLYLSEGNPADKKGTANFGYISSIHSSQQYQQYRQCASNRNASVLTGIGHGHKLIMACNNKALIQVYLWGKDSPEQRIPIPEELSCLTICEHPTQGNGKDNNWLLVGGGKSGKLYIWELSSGLLLNVRECHYQSVSVIKYKNGFLISGGLDSRIVIWKILDLLNDVNFDDQASMSKPFGIIADHTLPITDLIISNGLIHDMKLYTSSRDSTIRCYEVVSKKLITTFILPAQITSISNDPAFRCLYAGLSNGIIRQIPLFSTSNNKSNILEAIGGAGKIVTVVNDPELQFTFLHHQSNLQSSESSSQEGDAIVNDVTALEISMDGTCLVSGDSKGRVFVVDVITKQIVKKLKTLAGSISTIEISQIDSKTLDSLNLVANSGNNNGSSSNHGNNDKNVIRAIPNLKRVLVDNTDFKRHDITKKIESINEFQQPVLDIDAFLDEVAQEQKFFVDYSMSEQDQTPGAINDSDRIKQLESQLSQLTNSYNELKQSHDKLTGN